MTSETTFQIGREVIVTRPWGEDELPTERNFHVGRVVEVLDAALGKYIVSGLDAPVYADRMRALGH